MAGKPTLWECLILSLLDQCDLFFQQTCHTVYHKQKEVQDVSRHLYQ